MYSQCPECQTRFRVTAAALRAARGTVRCGRCGSAFDALVRLTDTLEDDRTEGTLLAAPTVGALVVEAGLDAPRDDLQLGSTGEQPPVSEFHFSAEDIERVFVDARDWQRRFGESEAPPPGLLADRPSGADARVERETEGLSAEPAQPGPPVVVHEPEAVEDITLEGERIVIEGVTGFEDEFIDDVRHDAELLPESEQPAAAEPVIDLDSTDRFETLRRVPESASPDEADDSERTDSRPALRPEFYGEAEASPALELLAPEPVATKAQDALGAAPDIAATQVRQPTSIQDDSPAAAVASAADADPLLAPPPWRRDSTRPVDHLEDFEEQSRGVRARVAWSVFASLLTLALVAQLVHHFRDELARDVTLGPLVRQAYATLGQPLAPSWDPALFEVRQWGADAAQSAGAGGMTVRASLRNRAEFAQPMPLLRLELENRFGDTVARRDFEPREYLKDPAQATRLLEPGGAVDAELALIDVGSEAVGYRLDACVPDDQGPVRCALATAAAAPQ